jgi:hypothetical protein
MLEPTEHSRPTGVSTPFGVIDEFHTPNEMLR